MKSKLYLDADRTIELHEDAVTQGFALLARRRSGKSYLAGVMMENFAERGDPFVVLDPVSAHWGIRYKVNKEGLPIGPSDYQILLVGGEHGDADLNPKGGKLLAQIIVDTNISTVIDLSLSSMTERKLFVVDFAHELFKLNKTPRHLFIEEAQEFCSQVPRFEEQKQVLGAMERLITEGGGRGLGFTLISQRPALVNKNVLTQIDNLFVLRITGPQDKKAVSEWFENNIADESSLDKVVSGLAAMKPGTAWLVSPEWLDTMVQFNVRERMTYHAGRTPKHGEKPVNVKQYKVGEVAKKFKDLLVAKEQEQQTEIRTFIEAKNRALKAERELAHIRKELNKKVLVQVQEKIVDPIVPQLREELKEIKKQYNLLYRIIDRGRKQLMRVVEGFQGIEDPKDIDKISAIGIHQGITPERPLLMPKQGNTYKEGTQVVDSYFKKDVGIVIKPPSGSMINPDSVKVSAGARRILNVLCQWYPHGISDGQVRSHAGLRKSGTYSTYLSTLRSLGYIERKDGNLYATQTAMNDIGEVPSAPQTTEEVLEIWRPKLSVGARRILDVLLENRGYVGREELAQAAGFSTEHGPSGTFSTYISSLRTARLIVSDSNGIKADSETLFL